MQLFLCIPSSDSLRAPVHYKYTLVAELHDVAMVAISTYNFHCKDCCSKFNYCCTLCPSNIKSIHISHCMLHPTSFTLMKSITVGYLVNNSTNYRLVNQYFPLCISIKCYSSMIPFFSKNCDRLLTNCSASRLPNTMIL